MTGTVGAGAATERAELQEVYVEQPVDVWPLGFLTKSIYELPCANPVPVTESWLEETNEAEKAAL